MSLTNLAEANEGPLDGGLQRHMLSEMSTVCSHCHALLFSEEKSRGSTSFFCCHNGLVPNELMKVQTPQTIRNLLRDPEFRKNIRRYNTNFAFSSSKVSLDRNLANGREGIYTFKINGTFHHQVPRNLLPSDGHQPKFAQLYIYDAEYQLQQRREAEPDLDVEVLRDLQDMIHSNNQLLVDYPGIVRLEQETNDDFQFKLLPRKRKEYELPTSNEITGIFDDSQQDNRNREVIFFCRSDSGPFVRTINQFHELYDPLHYVLLFPCGESSWTPGLPVSRTSGRSRKLTALQYYRYRLFDRDADDFGHFTLAGRLFHEFIVDGWVKVEEGRLCWIKISQVKIRAALYSGLQDNPNANNIGRKILPASFQGGPRFYSQLFQDALAIVRHFGKPTFFVTFTTNPKWDEIIDSLPMGLSANDRPDIVCRVFKLKFQAFLKHILKGRVLGKIKAYFYRVEFQKRGLPHAHCLFITEDDVVRTSDDVNNYTCAEIPDSDTNPLLFETVKTCMIHGPCKEQQCMKNGSCTKGFPKEFCDETVFSEDGYPKYRRRNDGRFLYRNGKKLDNRYVVPYNPELCTIFNAHINVEICSSIKAAKYIYKYIYKGGDHLSADIIDLNDEIKRHLDGRSVTATEAAYRLFGFSLHGESVTVIALPVHCENEQVVVYDPEKDIHTQMECAAQTKLTDYFALNARDHEAHQYFYFEIPQHYTWNTTNKKWCRRSQHSKTAIGRLISISPSAGEKYFLRILLTKLKGSLSFAHLRTKDGVTYETYRDACLAYGFIEDGDTIISTFQEICQCLTNPVQICYTFADFLIHAPVNDVAYFYQQNEHILKEADRVLNLSRNAPPLVHLCYIADRLSKAGQQHIGSFLPSENLIASSWFNQPEAFDPFLFGDSDKPYNTEQTAFFDRVTQETLRISFLDGPGGTGKTYLLKGICAHFHQNTQKVWVCASSGIAATMYPLGKTAHSLLRIPLQCNSSSILGISKGTNLHEELKEVKLLIFDEVTMASGAIIDTIDRSLQDLLENDSPFGGITIIFAGDFRQLLPVSKHASQAQAVQNCCIFSKAWQSVIEFKLTQNMRTNDAEWAEFLLTVGNATANDQRGHITLPEQCIIAEDLEEMIATVFGTEIHSTEYQGLQCILAPTNKICDQVNEQIIDALTTEEHTYVALDVNESEEYIPSEFLNTIKTGGLPNHEIKLKVNAIVMCLRNLSPELTNGTRLRVTKIGENFILGRIITQGAFEGKEVPIFKVKLYSSETEFPFIFSRTQLPIRLSYCMTIHKSQCQTFKKVGLFLDDQNECFSHGQLYVALSRVSEGASGIVAFQRNLKNVVYPNIVQQL